MEKNATNQGLPEHTTPRSRNHTIGLDSDWNTRISSTIPSGWPLDLIRISACRPKNYFPHTPQASSGRPSIIRSRKSAPNSSPLSEITISSPWDWKAFTKLHQKLISGSRVMFIRRYRISRKTRTANLDSVAISKANISSWVPLGFTTPVLGRSAYRSTTFRSLNLRSR